MSPRILDLGDVIAHFQPGPTGPADTGPGTGDGSRPGPRVVDLVQLRAVVDAIAQDPPSGPLVTDLRAAMVRSRAARGEVA